jgi:hypothetical protein
VVPVPSEGSASGGIGERVVAYSPGGGHIDERLIVDGCGGHGRVREGVVGRCKEAREERETKRHEGQMSDDLRS